MGPEDQHDLPIEREEYEIWARKEEVKALRRALVTIMDMIEKGILVRNTSADDSITAFVEQSVGLTLALKQAQDAINLGRLPNQVNPHSMGFCCRYAANESCVGCGDSANGEKLATSKPDGG